MNWRKVFEEIKKILLSPSRLPIFKMFFYIFICLTISYFIITLFSESTIAIYIGLAIGLFAPLVISIKTNIDVIKCFIREKNGQL